MRTRLLAAIDRLNRAIKDMFNEDLSDITLSDYRRGKLIGTPKKLHGPDI